MNKILKNRWIVGIGVTVIGGLVLYYVFGIGKNYSGDIYDTSSQEVINYASQNAENNNGDVIQIQGDVKINEQAIFNISSKNIEKNKVTLMVNSTEGILPTRICVSISTDSVVYHARSSFSGLREGDRQKRMCFTNPPGNFTLTYDLKYPPSFFEAKVE